MCLWHENYSFAIIGHFINVIWILLTFNRSPPFITVSKIFIAFTLTNATSNFWHIKVRSRCHKIVFSDVGTSLYDTCYHCRGQWTLHTSFYTMYQMFSSKRQFFVTQAWVEKENCWTYYSSLSYFGEWGR